MATDIVDKDLKELRNGRWAKVFAEQTCTESAKDAVDRKATTVVSFCTSTRCVLVLANCQLS